jgi:hypothetical protein
VSPLLAHVAGVPVEEGLLVLAPAGTAVVGVVALVARARLVELVAWFRRR